jgi:hypothetical protein
MEKMRFSLDRYMNYQISKYIPWYTKIIGKDVKFSPGSNIGICDGYVILREWCEPINSSDNNDK